MQRLVQLSRTRHEPPLQPIKWRNRLRARGTGKLSNAWQSRRPPSMAAPCIQSRQIVKQSGCFGLQRSGTGERGGGTREVRRQQGHHRLAQGIASISVNPDCSRLPPSQVDAPAHNPAILHAQHSARVEAARPASPADAAARPSQTALWGLSHAAAAATAFRPGRSDGVRSAENPCPVPQKHGGAHAGQPLQFPLDHPRRSNMMNRQFNRLACTSVHAKICPFVGTRRQPVVDMHGPQFKRMTMLQHTQCMQQDDRIESARKGQVRRAAPGT